MTVGGEDWKIEARPKTQRAKDETGYVKTQVWINKSKLVPLQVKAWVREDESSSTLSLVMSSLWAGSGPQDYGADAQGA